MGAANQKTTIDTHTQKKKYPKHNTRVIKSQENKRRREED